MGNGSNRRYEFRGFDESLLDGFLGDLSIIGYERISTGKANTNFRLELIDGRVVIFRIFSEKSPSSPAREKHLVSMLGDSVPVPKMLDHGFDWAVYEFVEGDLLASCPEHSQAAARVVARMAEVKLDTVGWITESGEIQTFDFGGDYFGMMLSKKEIVDALGADQLSALQHVLSDEQGRLDEINADISLVHGDFNPTNILIQNGEVSAVLDWEWGHAGTPYMDIGNLRRNVDEKYHDSIGQGLVEGGFELPADWQKRVALIDLGSHLEFLSSSHSDHFKRTRVQSIDSFISMIGN